MRTLFVGNFSFEHELSQRSPRQRSRAEQILAEDLATVWLAVAEPGDLIWTPARIETSDIDELASFGLPRVQCVTDAESVGLDVRVCPWGWSQDVVRRAEQFGGHCDAPDLSAVRDANSRANSARLEQEWGVGPPGAVEVRSVEQFVSAVGQLATDMPNWVVKAMFSMSARERILGRGDTPSEQAVAWVRKRLAIDGAVFLEPWLERFDEAGLQFTVPRSGPPRLEGVTSLRTSELGAYRGSCVVLQAAEEEVWKPAVATGFRIAEDLQRRGYFGPLGIDAARYRGVNGEIRLRPIQDINARYTMGRLALGLRKLLRPGEDGSWLHVGWSTGSQQSPREWFRQAESAVEDLARLIRTSPFDVGSRPTRHGTLFVIADAEGSLREAESLIEAM